MIGRTFSVNSAATLCVTVSAMVPLVSEPNSGISKVAEPHDVSFFPFSELVETGCSGHGWTNNFIFLKGIDCRLDIRM